MDGLGEGATILKDFRWTWESRGSEGVLCRGHGVLMHRQVRGGRGLPSSPWQSRRCRECRGFGTRFEEGRGLQVPGERRLPGPAGSVAVPNKFGALLKGTAGCRHGIVRT